MVLPASRFSSRDEVEHDGDFVDAHAGGRLVEHQDVRLQRHHHRDFELALVAVRQRGDGRGGAPGKPDPRQRRLRRRDDIAARAPGPRHLIMHAGARLTGQPHVLEHAEPRKQVCELKRAAKPERARRGA